MAISLQKTVQAIFSDAYTYGFLYLFASSRKDLFIKWQFMFQVNDSCSKRECRYLFRLTIEFVIGHSRDKSCRTKNMTQLFFQLLYFLFMQLLLLKDN